MALRLVSAGRGEVRDLVVVYYLGAYSDRKLRDACPPNTVIVNDTRKPTARYTRMRPNEGIDPLVSVREWAIRQSGALGIDRTILLGFSAGCQALRTQLLAGEAPDAVVAVDGTHSGTQAAGWQIDPWRDYLDLALGDKAVFVASHTQIVPPGYASTRKTLERVTGWVLPGKFPGGLEWAEHQESSALVVSYPGANAAAHSNQATRYAPQLLSRAFQMLSELPEDTEPDMPHKPSTPPWRSPHLTIGERAVAFSLAEHEAGVQEVPPGSNAGPRIAEYFTPATRDGGPLGIRSGNWCVAAAMYAERASLLDGEEMTLPYTVSGVEVQRDAAQRGLWRPVDVVRTGGWTPKVGDLVVLDRGNGLPRTKWWRHVCRVMEAPDGGSVFRTIDGNSGVGWAERRRDLFAPKLLGFVELPSDVRKQEGQELDQSHLLQLSDDVTAGRVGMENAISSLYRGTG